MMECPGCLGEGVIDFRDADAYLGEFLTDAELAMVPRDGPAIIQCAECEGAGEIGYEMWAELRIVADRAIRRLLDRVALDGFS